MYFILKVGPNGKVYGINADRHIVVKTGVNGDNPLGTNVREEFSDINFNDISAGDKKVYAILQAGTPANLQVSLY